MDDKKKKTILVCLIFFAITILLIVGSTFAYFTATVSSNEGAISLGAAVFEIGLTDDTDLIKNNLIPSIEEYVDIASARTVGDDFAKPYEEDDKIITEGTACIDDNLNEICSIYTFTITNSMTDNDLPLYITLNPNINTFENLYMKILDSNKNVISNSKVQLIDDRYETETVDGKIKYVKDTEGNRIEKDNFNELKISPIVLTSINNILPRATKDQGTGDIIPTSVTYSLVMWIMETGYKQNDEDSNKLFASTLNVNASGADGRGITGIISAAGNE